MKRLILAGMLALGTVHAAQADDALKAAIASKDRTLANVARDAARHPYETLTFFGIRPDMTVVELAPGGGWYTEILAPYLRDKGKLIVAGESPSSTDAGARRYADNLGKKLAANPAMYGKVQRAVFEPPRAYDIAPANSVDMVLTFRNLHNWMGEGDEGLKKTLAEVYKVVKPGGILGIEDHRLPASRKAGSTGGYVHQDYVIKMAESVGFKFVDKSEVNANPKDTADYAKGVWSLPPTLANKDVDRDKYLAIGESDRMTLKFVKPK
ncbi:class I SAM-dependent methyltransferase [Massilia sp. TN1-12]|uniref:class I SAM-dependent methyltransferase n=1 Tax=Massilia paldalensis TaxID=3377675 RepID=UPI00384AAD93